MADYRCNHCGHVVQRDSARRWIKSYCDTTGKSTRLWRMTSTEILRRAPALMRERAEAEASR